MEKSKDFSVGVITYRYTDGFEFLLVYQKEGYWGFPKGHQNNAETFTETAIREVREETGLLVTLVEGFETKEIYTYEKHGVEVTKTVLFFLGNAEGEPLPDGKEVLACRWVAATHVSSLLMFPEAVRCFEKTLSFLKEKGP